MSMSSSEMGTLGLPVLGLVCSKSDLNDEGLEELFGEGGPGRSFGCDCSKSDLNDGGFDASCEGGGPGRVFCWY